MTKRSRNAVALIAAAVICLGIGGFLAKAQISAIMTKSPARDRPLQRAQEEVIAAFVRIERAMRDGDGSLFLSLIATKALAGMSDEIKDGYRKGMLRRPGLHLEPVAVVVRGDQAFVVAKFEDPANKDAKSYLVRYMREDGGWKIADQTTSDAPVYRPAVYAFLPPEGGAFTRAGSPWRTIAAAGPTVAGPVTRSVGTEPAWKMRAVRDEAFLYIRLQAMTSLPAPGSDISADDAARAKAGAPPVMIIAVTTPDDKQTLVKSSFEFQVISNVRATGMGRLILEYSLVVRGDRGETLFGGSPGAFNHLIEVRDTFIDVRLPLKSLGLHTRSAPDIDIRDATAPPQSLPYKVVRFSP